MVQLVATLLLIAIHTAITFFISPSATLLALAAGGILTLSQIPQMRGMAKHGAAAGQGMRNVHAMVSEHMASMKLAKSCNAEAMLSATFASEVERLGNTAIMSVDELANGRARQKIAAATLLAVVVGTSVLYLHIVGARLLLLVAVFARLLPAIGQALQAAQRGAELLPAYGDMESLRRYGINNASPPHIGGALAPKGPMRLQDVSYTWPGRDRPALSAITLEIPENRTTALIGPSGAGKSTLADLCLGLLEPTMGTITVGQSPLSGPLWRQCAAVVPQDVFLFHHTVRANLAWANSEATEAQLWEALEAADAAELVRNLPQGLETLVGDRGVRLSGGERQRLVLARALLRRPAFLVLDEATSHLDTGHERMIQRSLDRLHGRLTVLVIAHRLSTIRNADQIVVIREGRIHEIGTWETLSIGQTDAPFV